ncbi:PaaX family transcriptional regulator [Zhihengliuella salsuginis]|uniref:PaaX family transcriptional regulator n=1 Tax=Zhihengliuella salsuginis TaxID=578222 RepID=A0ABQ3GIH2_9MICC|nr:PaaX family transcriptional regulator C-terminal domain-containing protein [Zhihengliuella salsuginis]GHD04980.1 PaaX family transcriptional regulator [Zhihengliuella salsuginis]
MAQKLLHQELIATLYGLYSSGEGMAVSSIVALLADLGIAGGAARSSISRLKAKGVLDRSSHDGETRYAMSPSALDVFHADDQRIFAPVRSGADDPWALVVFSVPEAERKRRYDLRRELESLGFGFVASGVAIAPEPVLDQALVRLEQRGLQQYVEHFVARYGRTDELRTRIRGWWDLGDLDTRYSDFIDDYADSVDDWRLRLGGATTAEADRAAFAHYVPLLTRWRRFPYRDPNIPLELLPEGWRAPQAKKIFLELHAMLRTPSRRHASSVLGAVR